MKWPDRRLLDLFGIDHPIIQAPMAGASSGQMAIAVSQAGGLGSIAAAMLTAETLRTELQIVQQGTGRSINVNFFVHQPPVVDAAREAGWRKRLEPYYRELGLPADAGVGGPVRAPFDAALCDVVLEFKPRVASFHFGLPDAALVKRLKAEKIVVISSATTAAEARWLEAHALRRGDRPGIRSRRPSRHVPDRRRGQPGWDHGAGAPGGRRGENPGDRGRRHRRRPRRRRGARAGGGSAQIGTAFLLTPEAKTVALHRAALKAARDDSTTLTNLFTGRPARGIINRFIREVGPLSADAPAFPLAAGAAFPAARRGRGQRLDRFHAAVERTGAVAGARAAVG